MAEAALKLAETTEVETKALSIVDQAKAVKVVDAGSYTVAGLLWKSIKDMMKEVADTFDPIIEKAHASHKEALAQKAKFYAPLEAAYRSVKGLMSTYDAEQERIRLAEQVRLDAIQKAKEEKERQDEIDRLKTEAKAEQDRLMAAAEAAEAAGDKQGAEELVTAAVIITEDVKQEAAEILSAPIQPPPMILPKTTPKLAGGPIYSTRWSASVTDIKALCLAIGTGRASTELVIGLDRDKNTGIITSPSLNSRAVSDKDQMIIPGVRAISKRV